MGQWKSQHQIRDEQRHDVFLFWLRVIIVIVVLLIFILKR